jgi:hypothetical protein
MKSEWQACPLCLHLAQTSVRPKSYGQWTQYACGNPQCGPSEVSAKARTRLRHSEQRHELRAFASSCRMLGAQPRIGYDGPTGEFQIAVVSGVPGSDESAAKSSAKAASAALSASSSAAGSASAGSADLTAPPTALA